jgi:hypothetical protein
MPWEGRGRGFVCGEGAEYALGGLASAAVGRGKELERVVGLEQRAQLTSGFFCLCMGGVISDPSVV